MSVKIVEEPETKYGNGLFLPPVTAMVRRCSQNALPLVSSCFFVLFSAAFALCNDTLGAVLLLVSVLVLICEITGLALAKVPRGGYGLKLRCTAYLISAVSCGALAVYEILKGSTLPEIKLDFGLGTIALPQPFATLINGGFIHAEIPLLCLAVSFLAVAVSSGALNRSNRKNRVFNGSTVVSFIINLLCLLCLVADGLLRLTVLPKIPLLSDLYGASSMAQSITAAVCFAFALCVLFNTINLLIISIRMRKVKNAVLKA
ncbi:MAG: hypothetical protein J6S13_00165 [Clostridia bacterium]|nr:hypothetical protein [Clostridia bacterium]